MACGLPLHTPTPTLPGLFSSPAASPTTLLFLRSTFPRKPCPPISISHSGDMSSSSSPAPLGVLDDAGVRITSRQEIGQYDLLIVGPGVLGRIVAEKWQKEHPGCQIFGQTMTTDHHDELISIGIVPSLRGSKLTNKFSYVIFCAPPSRTPDYPGDIRLASLNWSGEGCFLFTSSTAVYDCNNNGFCDEDAPLVPIGRSPRTDVLLKAEKETLDIGGCVVRLAGLYISLSAFVQAQQAQQVVCIDTTGADASIIVARRSDKDDRGAHIYWLSKGTVDIRPDHILNLIHYEDAASLSIAIMKKKLRGRVFLGCDNHPLSRQQIMDYGNQSGKYSKKFLGFTGTDDPLGKRMNNSKTRAELGWEPKYTSFSQFLGRTA